MLAMIKRTAKIAINNKIYLAVLDSIIINYLGPAIFKTNFNISRFTSYYILA